MSVHVLLSHESWSYCSMCTYYSSYSNFHWTSPPGEPSSGRTFLIQVNLKKWCHNAMWHHDIIWCRVIATTGAMAPGNATETINFLIIEGLDPIPSCTLFLSSADHKQDTYTFDLFFCFPILQPHTELKGHEHMPDSCGFQVLFGLRQTWNLLKSWSHKKSQEVKRRIQKDQKPINWWLTFVSSQDKYICEQQQGHHLVYKRSLQETKGMQQQKKV